MYDVYEKTILELGADLACGKTTSLELVYSYLDRIATIDAAGPCLRSVIEINPDVYFIAEAMDEERKNGTVRGLLHGIPFLVKDNISTGDKMQTTAASITLEGLYAPEDAPIVKKLRDAGAVLLGKANMSEFAYFVSFTMPNGFSSRGGQVLSPYQEGGDPSGSSTGSAVAVTANLCAFAIGTETDGSIISPSRNNSIVGIKPTVGLVSRRGIIPISNIQDTAGPMCRTVEDAAIVLSAIAGLDEQDAATWKSEIYQGVSYENNLHKNGLEGLRIGINRAYIDDLPAGGADLFEQAVDAMQKMGAAIVENCDMEKAGEEALTVLTGEFKQVMNAHLGRLRDATPQKTLEDIMVFQERHYEQAIPYGNGVFLQSERDWNGRGTDAAYIKARIEMTQKCREGIDQLLQENNIDLLYCPTHFDVAAYAGYPSVMVPIGMLPDGMPFGACFVGTAFAEDSLIKAAYAFEQGYPKRVPPKFEEVK